MAADYGEVTGVILGWVFLFIGGFVLFIHDDEAGVLYGGEYGGACANDDAGLAGSDAVPFIKAFALGEVRVEDRDLIDEIMEAGFKALHRLRGEGDFWGWEIGDWLLGDWGLVEGRLRGG